MSNFEYIKQTIAQFNDNLREAVEAFNGFLQVHDSLAYPQVAYRRAGYPYGKSVRGFKKWRKVNG